MAKPNGYPDDGSTPFWSGWPGTPDPSGNGTVPYPWEHGPVPGSGVTYPWENNPNAPSWPAWEQGTGIPNMVGGYTKQPDTPSVTMPGSHGTGPWDITALKWLGALALLWIILTALTEYSPNTKPFGQAFAGLILMGALYALGPQAIANIPNLWKSPGG